ncbi:hypothetical protein [Rhodococcus sp. MALMAid1271]|uniref:hypothetical protein n=1 Tax=Rhodococcus sp. MALMAid1271 TaxID=3411744 RepID=UPI003B9EBD15
MTEENSERPNVVAKLPTGVAATDTANLLAAIAAVPEGGRLFIPSSATFYNLNAPLVITKSMTIEGSSLTETWKPRANGGALNHPNAPGVAGAVLMQSTAAADVLQITGSAISVNLKNLGITWAPAILNTNTGHGVTARPTLTRPAGGHDSGLLGFKWDNVTVYGHDGNHWAFDLLNTMYFTLTHLHSYGGGGIHFECDSFEGNYGNAVVIEPYAEIINTGNKDGYRLTARTKYANTGVLNLLTFVRPQANVTGPAAAAQTQKAWNNVAGTATPSYVDIISPDFEGVTWAGAVDFGGANGGTIVRRGGLITSKPVGGMSTDAGYQKFTTTGNFFVPEGVYELRYRVTGSGGGGGGGGSNAAAAANVGGGGGGAGLVAEGTIAVTPRQTIIMTCGLGGTGGAGGAAGGNPGIKGNDGAQTKIAEDVKVIGGGGGAPGLASSTTAAAGGWYARTGSVSMVNSPGFGGNGQSPNGIAAVQLPPGVVGGGGGGAATASLGGGPGTASTVTAGLPALFHVAGGNSGASSTVDGVNGVAAVTPGCGGGGGGGATIGGAGGAGGAGAPGSIELWW